MTSKDKKGFQCLACGQWIEADKFIGTHFRNHCPFCLWSQHVDEQKSGDRRSLCHGMMEPIGLTFKNEGFDKYGQRKQGELMVIHLCQDCGHLSINRLAADDKPETVLKIFEASLKLPSKIKNILK
ncbi:RNHCP domain-containing protein, partial [Candidatus Shapirobacteria bacterium]|nr:RNHCP domain-containing protein [Candidatus Shapirobacteria bacterium]